MQLTKISVTVPLAVGHGFAAVKMVKYTAKE